MQTKSFFKDTDWDQMRHKTFSEEAVPYRPNPNKYRYLLHNEYPEISNLDSATTDLSKGESPKKNLLGDFTMMKVNKEFEDF